MGLGFPGVSGLMPGAADQRAPLVDTSSLQQVCGGVYVSESIISINRVAYHKIGEVDRLQCE